MSDGSPPASERFLDIYALLGLRSLEPDRARIQQSLKRLAGQIQGHSQSTAENAPTPAQIGRARKLFELGKQHLLDPAAKLRYDQQWQAVYGTVPATSPVEKQATDQQPQQSLENRPLATADRSAVTAPLPTTPPPTTPPASVLIAEQTWDLSELQTLLPQGDPSAPFNPAEYQASRTPERTARHAEDFDKLLNLLALQPVNDHSAAVAASAAAIDNASNPSTSEEPAVSSSPGAQLAAHASMLPQPPRAPLAQRLRKKQGPPLLWRATGVVAAVGIVLGIAFWRLQPAKQQPAQDPALAVQPGQESSLAVLPAADDWLSATRSPAVAATVNQPATVNQQPAPRRSGLPAVPGIDTILPAGEASRQGAAMSLGGGSAQAQSAMPDRAMQNDAMSDMPPPDTAASPQTNPLSDQERQQWTQAMLAARDALGQQQFIEATAQLDSLRSQARTQLQTEQLTRLVTIAQLAARFRQALDTALAGMGAAESFAFGDGNLASFVEADGERIVLRIEGKNQIFAMPEISTEITFAIVDMAMDREHPRSLAAKAAFILVHPAAQGDQDAVQQAQQMMSAAVAARAIPQDMLQALQDDFELP